MSSIQALQSTIYQRAVRGSVLTATAAIITLTALTIITCTGLALTLPGANALQHFVYPVLCPCLTFLFLTAPLFFFARNIHKLQEQDTDKMLEKVKTNFDAEIPKLIPQQRRDYVIRILFPSQQSYIPASTLANRLIACYPKTPEGNDKKVTTAISKATMKIAERAEADEQDEKIAKAKEKIEEGTPILEAIKAADDAWGTQEQIRAIKDLMDCYMDGSPEGRERTELRELLKSEFQETYDS